MGFEHPLPHRKRLKTKRYFMKMLPNPQNCHYQSCYCEENIWHLCQHPACTNSTVIFIASHGGMFPMLCQRATNDPTTPVWWDYHVILMLGGRQPVQVLDFDTVLPFRSDLNTYLQASFLPEVSVTKQYQPYFRLVPAQDYISEFRSDRSHMRTEDGWSAPPPDWPIIGDGGSNLARFTDMRDHAIGEVLSYQQLLERS